VFVAFSRYFRMVNFGIILSKNYKLGSTDVDRQIILVVITMVLLMYVSSGMYCVIENLINNDGTNMNFHVAVYFVVVTLLTVGYGDIIPSNNWCKLIVLFIVVFTIVLIPR
jgi:hypothetical protein